MGFLWLLLERKNSSIVGLKILDHDDEKIMEKLGHYLNLFFKP